MTKHQRSTVEGAVTSLNEASQLAQDQHPAEALGETLGRIDTLLTAMGAMFVPGRESFAVNDSFVMHSLLAAAGLVVAAQDALSQLQDGCDLTLLSQQRAVETGTAAPENAKREPVAPAEEYADLEDSDPIPYTPLSSSRFVEQVTSSAANKDFSEILAKRHEAAQQDALRDERVVLQEGLAQNYLELLRKLTAAEIFAAEQQALSPPGTQHQLLPLLRSLREDFQKIHSAA
jgi:hypothetical protein